MRHRNALTNEVREANELTTAEITEVYHDDLTQEVCFLWPPVEEDLEAFHERFLAQSEANIRMAELEGSQREDSPSSGEECPDGT